MQSRDVYKVSLARRPSRVGTKYSMCGSKSFVLVKRSYLELIFYVHQRRQLQNNIISRLLPCEYALFCDVDYEGGMNTTPAFRLENSL